VLSQEIAYFGNDARHHRFIVQGDVISRIQLDQPGMGNRCRQSASFIKRRNGVFATVNYEGRGLYLTENITHIDLVVRAFSELIESKGISFWGFL
jgi:hypothetical protein